MTLLFSSDNERPPANKSFVRKLIGSHRMESAAACGEALAILSDK
jgi:hypothetical protein